jgi:TRAP-type C4-dicarboxylate transport system permease small subunit
MRRMLDTLYDGAAWLAALFMVGLLAMVLLGIVSRLLHFHVPGTDAYAGYMMAGAGFLALAHTLKRGEHIRVTLLLSVLKGSARRGIEVWALGAAVLLAGLSAWYSCRLSWQSHLFHDISAGNVILLIAFIDEFVLELRGQRQQPTSDESLRNE